VRRFRGNSLANQIAERTAEEHALSIIRCYAGQSRRHNRCIHAVDPALDCDESDPACAGSHRLLHFPHKQHRRHIIADRAAPAGWREPLVVLTALGSYLATHKRIRTANDFTFGPLIEVAWLFVGIFGTMIPVLEFMEGSARQLGLSSDSGFYWATGLLSAI